MTRNLFFITQRQHKRSTIFWSLKPKCKIKFTEVIEHYISIQIIPVLFFFIFGQIKGAKNFSLSNIMKLATLPEDNFWPRVGYRSRWDAGPAPSRQPEETHNVTKSYQNMFSILIFYYRNSSSNIFWLWLLCAWITVLKLKMKKIKQSEPLHLLPPLFFTKRCKLTYMNMSISDFFICILGKIKLFACR